MPLINLPKSLTLKSPIQKGKLSGPLIIDVQATKDPNGNGNLKISAGTRGNITDITAATPPVVTSASHGRSNGDRVLIEGVVGMTEVRGFYTVANQTANTFELNDAFGNNIVGAGFTAYTSGGQWKLVQHVASALAVHVPYDADGVDADATAATITIGTIQDDIIPVSIPAFNADNVSGNQNDADGNATNTPIEHRIELEVTYANPAEVLDYTILLPVPRD